MKKSKFSETQIISILKEFESDMPATELYRKHGVHPKTFYAWKNRYAGMNAAELKKLKELEAENTKLKKMYAELSLLNYAMKDMIDVAKRNCAGTSTN